MKASLAWMTAAFFFYGAASYAAQTDSPPAPERTILFPLGDLFQPLLADPKQPRFSMTYAHFNLDTATPFTAWIVGFGETIGLARWRRGTGQDGLQLSALAGLVALFNWSTASKDLINADYTFGGVLSWRRSNTSARFRILHQSSHLGDEYLINFQPERINLSYEAVDALLSQSWKRLRFYGGGGVLFAKEPANLDRNRMQAGLEYYGSRWRDRNRFARPIAAFDFQSFEQNKWRPNYSVRAGFEIGRTSLDGRRLRLMGEFFDGYSPFGQFYNTRIRYTGLGISLSL